MWYLQDPDRPGRWIPLDRRTSAELPAKRNSASVYYEVPQIGRNQFRLAFLLELCADLLAFIWLATGTNYVSLSETCVDSAPML